MPGVVDMTTRSVAGRRPASGHAVVTIGRRPVFVKSGEPAALAHEAAVLRHLQRARAGEARLAPAPLVCDSRSGRLYVEALPRWRTLHDLFTEGEGDELANARRLGGRLAELHEIDPAGLPAAADHLPRLELGPLQMAELPGETLALIGLLQRVPRLQDDLAELRAAVPEPTLVHGDMKLDNVLCGPGDRMVLVDFEHAGIGDPAWDAGAALGDYLSRWLLSVRCAPEEPLATWLRGAAVSALRCASAGRELLAGYWDVRPLPDLDRIAASAGVFMLHRAQAWIERYSRLGAKATLLAHCGGGLIRGRWRALEPLLEQSR